MPNKHAVRFVAAALGALAFVPLNVAAISSAQGLPRAAMTWNDAAYSCVQGVFEQPDPNIPSWEQHIAVYVSLRGLAGIAPATCTSSYDDAPASAPEATAASL
jgi:hypothetical protein